MNRSFSSIVSSLFAGLSLVLASGCAAGDLDSADSETAEMMEEGMVQSGLQVSDDGQDDRVRRPAARPRGTFDGMSLYVEPDSNPARQASEWSGWSEGKAKMDLLAAQPLSLWVGDWNSDVAETVDEALDDGRDAGGKIRSIVVYNIPHRDCGYWSAGGASDAGEYAWFISEVARGIGGRQTIVILEPDALALNNDECLSSSQQAERSSMLWSAVSTLKAAGASVYLDAGDSNWVQADDMSEQLWAAGIENAAGFALNVSHTETTSDSIGYANELRAIVGTSAKYVIDTGRNGNGPTWDNEWCNPREGTTIGEFPSLATGVAGLDAYLWIKAPGESDGYCNGGPDAGSWWSDYAYELAL